mmetsp:Transcript_44227/g.134028  ORF Transcript_44227/g.134028 Transcript_44227/m.134028 type:complete len:312 (+) Transcript_44227:144-1079(+)
MLLHRQQVQQGVELRAIPDQRPHGVTVLVNIDAIHGDTACAGLQLPAHHLEGRGLPGAVDAEQPEDLAPGDAVRHAADRPRLPVVRAVDIVHDEDLRRRVEGLDAGAFGHDDLVVLALQLRRATLGPDAATEQPARQVGLPQGVACPEQHAVEHDVHGEGEDAVARAGDGRQVADGAFVLRAEGETGEGVELEADHDVAQILGHGQARQRVAQRGGGEQKPRGPLEGAPHAPGRLQHGQDLAHLHGEAAGDHVEHQDPDQGPARGAEEQRKEVRIDGDRRDEQHEQRERGLNRWVAEPLLRVEYCEHQQSA